MSMTAPLTSKHATPRTRAAGPTSEGTHGSRFDRRGQEVNSDTTRDTELEPHWSASIDGATD